MTRSILVAWAAAILLAGCGGGGGGGGGDTAAPPPAPSVFTDPNVYSSAPGASLATPNEITSVTRHQVTIAGVPLAYTATAGHLTALLMGTGEPQASFFYVAYALDGRDPATRPVTFFFNGGPGSATVWLHLGSFGPRRLVTNAPATSPGGPFPLVENTESMLDLSDLVFVNAVGSGLSQAIAPHTNQTFWSVDADAAVFRDFVMRYVAANGRGASPKFLFGESYGGPRAAVLARLLETAGMPLAGVVVQSPALNYNSNCGVIVERISCAGYLPSYAAAGAWFSRSNPTPAPGNLDAFLVQARALASTQYGPAVTQFINGGAAPAQSLLVQLADTTGMPVANWQAQFNLPPGYFQRNLIPGSILGRYDARMAASLGSNLASQGDPSSTYISQFFASGIANYLPTELLFRNPSVYVTLSNAIQTWDFTHNGQPLPDTIPDLATAFTLNPRLKFLSVSGYHDLATPFFTTEMDLARLGANPNVQVKNYAGGHMTYLDDVARARQKADMVTFYQSAVAPVAQAETKRVVGPLSMPDPSAEPMQAGAEVAMLDPWVPAEKRKRFAGYVPTQGEALRAQVEGHLREGFASDGTLTLEQARAAGLGFIVRHFDAIDRRKAGVVRFEDLQHFLRDRSLQPG